MPWISIALIGYFLNAVATLLDKHLLNRQLPNAALYTFYTGILSAGVVVLAPFGFFIPEPETLVLAGIAGGCFVVSWYFLYRTMRLWEASRVAPMAGIASMVLLFLHAHLIVREELTRTELLGFLFLLTGGILLVLVEDRRLYIRWDVAGGVLLAAVFFSIMLLVSKTVYDRTPFINAFIWIRLASALSAVLLLAPARTRSLILRSHAATRPAAQEMVVVNKFIGALGFITLNYAISIGPAVLINALRATEYAFLFLLVTGVSLAFPRFLHEETAPKAILQKIFGILLAGVGTAFLLG